MLDRAAYVRAAHSVVPFRYDELTVTEWSKHYASSLSGHTYPSSARSFGQQAARIAKSAPGTTVAVTSGGSSAAAWFIDGFKSMRPGSNFIRESGSPYGSPGEWESGPFVTWKYTVP